MKKKAPVIVFNKNDVLDTLAIVKNFLINTSAKFNRDDNFFITKYDLNIRSKLYLKKFKFNELQKGSSLNMTCRSYVLVIRKTLWKVYKIKTKLYSSGKDKYKHYALLIKIGGKMFYIDPLLDLVNYKLYAKSKYFAIANKHLPQIDVLSSEENDLINNKIGYNQKNALYIDFLHKFNLNKGIKSCFDFFQKHNINGCADYIIAYKTIIEDLETDNTSFDFFPFVINKNFIYKGIDIDNEKFGIIIFQNDKKNIYIKIKNVVREINQKQILFLSKQGCINIIPKFSLKSYKHLREHNCNRNILNHLCFQKVLNDLENIKSFDIHKITIKARSIEFNMYKLKFFIKWNKLYCKYKHKVFKYKITKNLDVYINDELYINYFNNFYKNLFVS